MIERLNCLYKQSYRRPNSFNSIDDVNYSLAMWVTYYSFQRPHKKFTYKPPIQNPDISMVENMTGK